MRIHYYIIGAVLSLALLLPSLTAARVKVEPKMYMFGFAASFNDTIVHFTEIQAVDSVWYDTKTKFLLGRSSYANQLRDYFSEKLNMPHRTCIVVFALNRKDIEKKYLKMKKLYTVKNVGRYDVKNLNESEFRFTPVKMVHENE